ncbi:MAG: hypothetical protein ABMA64_07285 [Myxococcota bacterium]
MWLVSTLALAASPCDTRATRKLLREAAAADGDAAARTLLDTRAECAAEWVVDVVGDPARRGAAELVVARLDTLPEELAVAAATAGVRGPHAALFEPALWSSGRARLRAVLAADAPPESAGGL